MMKRLAAALLALLMLCTAALGESDKDALDAQVQKIFKRHGASSAAVLVAVNGQLVYEYYYGLKDRKAKLPVDENTYFKIASVSKMVTAIRVMQLVEEGKLDLDEDISTYLGYKVVNPYYPKVPLTLRMLMTHTSSLRSNGGYAKESNTLPMLIDSGVKKQTSNFNREVPGAVYRYSNFGAGVMGSLMEAVEGRNLNDVLQDLFGPLGIEGGYYCTLLNEEDVQPQFHKGGRTYLSKKRMYTNDDYEEEPNPDKHYRICYGRVFIRGRDLLKLGTLLCSGGVVDDVRYLKEETVQEMLSSQEGKGGVTVDSPYGLCVNRITNLLKDRMVYGHQGLLSEQVYNLYFEPQTGFVFVLMGNGINSSMNDHIAVVARNCFDLMWTTFAAAGAQ